MDSENVWSFVLGVAVGMLIGGLLIAFGLELRSRKFCPTCGEVYGEDSVYCEDDGTLLKERGN